MRMTVSGCAVFVALLTAVRGLFRLSVFPSTIMEPLSKAKARRWAIFETY
jgi:hypothetical protein